LPQNSVNYILEDGEGYIWAGTQDGLVRFNGYSFEVFQPSPDDPYSLSDNFVIKMIEDESGRLWISTRDGINILEKQSKRFYKLNNPLSENANQPNGLHHDGSHVWVTYSLIESSYIIRLPDTLAFTEPETTFSKNHVVKNNDIPVLANFYTSDTTYVLTPDSVYKIHGIDTIHSQPKLVEISGEIAARHIIGAEQIWFVGGQSLYQLSKSHLTIREVDLQNDALSLAHYDSHLLVGTEDGIMLFNESLVYTGRLESTEESFRNVIIHDLMVDSNNNLWIGTANKGLFQYHEDQEDFNYVIPTQYDQSFEDHVWSANYRDGLLVVGTNRGILEMKPGTGEQVKRSLASNQVKSVMIDRNGNIWAGTFNEGLLMKRKNEMNFEQVFFIGSDVTGVISVLKEDHHGNLLVGTYGGLYYLNPDKPSIIQEIKLSSSYILAVYEDNRGRIWIGHNAGFSIYDPDTGLTREFPYQKGDRKSVSFNFVTGFAKVDGQVYIATYGGGLCKMEQDSTFTNFTQNEGLSNNIIHAMMSDHNGNLWMTSNGGISVFKTGDLTFKNFTRANGLLGHDFSISAMDNSLKDHFLVGTLNGLLVFHPDSVQTHYPSPQLKIEGVEINYSPIEQYKVWSKTNPLILYPKDRALNVEYTALHYQNPEDVRIEYQLAGFESEWITAQSSQWNVFYSSLPSGSYTLFIKALSKGNLFEPVVTSIPLKVLPPIWYRPIFLVPAILFLLTSIISTVYTLSRRKLKQRVKELETKERIQEERERISRDLHDSVGTHLAYIVSRLDYLYMGWEKKNIPDRKESLGTLSDFARSGMRMLRETIWALNQSEVSAVSFKSKINDYLKFCFDNQEIKLNFEFHSNTEEINSSVALHCFRIIQESVNNGMKHANATEISVFLRIKDSEHFELQINDNGKGFDIDRVKQQEDHYGLKNMEERAKEMTAHLELSSNDKGTQILVEK
jgi:signal transduction histidine kinase/ligand-binding sensor domain-containing protein